MTTIAKKTRRVPASALQFALGTCAFAAGPEGDETPSAGEARAVELVCRTAQPAFHQYWGKCVHDMAGFSVMGGGDKLPLDYCHDPREVLGYCDRFSADAKTGLKAAGQVVPVHGEDTATAVLTRADAGVPYQCSIMPDPSSLSIEEVGENATTQVNGYDFAGPGVVFRQWALRGVALCPYGVDASTSAKFSAGDPAEVEITYFSHQEVTMATETPAAPAAPVVPAALPAAAPLSVPAPGVEVKHYDRKAEGAKFTEIFGPEKGAKYFTEGLTLDEAQASFAKDLLAENATLKSRLAAVANAGEIEPLSAGPGDAGVSAVSAPAADDREAQRLVLALGPNVARYALSVQLPAKK
jgi:hypothetical protein